jgi:hypothetical protein
MLLLAGAAVCAAQGGNSVQAPALTGRTLDSKGQPLRKVYLTLLPLGTNAAGDSPAPYGVTSDAQGAFEFYGVPPGRYRLTAEHAKYLTTVYGARNTWAPGTVLTLRAGAPLNGITVKMTERAILSGKVVTNEKAAAWLVEVYRQKYQNGRRQWVCVDAVNTPGEFRFEELTAGRYRIGAAGSMSLVPLEDDAAQRYVATYYPGVTDLAAAETIELRAGQAVTDIRLTRLTKPVPFGSLRGSIVRKPSPGPPMVYLAAPDWEEPAYVSLAKDRFSRDQLETGSYILGVLVDRQMERQLVGWQTVQVSGDVEAPVFDLDGPGLRGTVKFEGGLAPGSGSNVRVKLIPVRDPLPYHAAGQVAPDGTFSIPGSFAGPFRIEVEGLPAGTYVKSAVYGEKNALNVLDLNFRSAGERLAVVVSAGAARVSGVVADDAGKPIEGFALLVPDPPQPQRPSLYRMLETDENGRFQFQGLAPGKYRLYAWEEFEPGAQFDPDATAPFQARSIAIDLPEGANKEVKVARISVEDAEAARVSK